MQEQTHKQVAIIVAHPNDETLWDGGAVLNHPLWKCYIVRLRREQLFLTKPVIAMRKLTRYNLCCFYMGYLPG